MWREILETGRGVEARDRWCRGIHSFVSACVLSTTVYESGAAVHDSSFTGVHNEVWHWTTRDSYNAMGKGL